MAKPASGTGLDSGNALYSHLTAAGSAVWAMLEGSGSSSADSSGNGHTLTKDGSVTWTTIGGDAALAFAGSSGQALAVTSPPSMAGTSSWSLAFRAKQSSSNTAGIVAGNENNAGANSFIFLDGGTAFFVRANTGTSYLENFETVFTADHDWLLSYDQPAARLHVYKDGAETASSPFTVSSNDAAVIFRSLGSGYDGAGSLALVGTMTYAYLMAGYAASGTDASNLHADPYSIFSAGGGSTPHLLGTLGVGA